MAHRLLLDTASLAYRAFFALPSTITDGDGRPVNAVRGYLDMVAQLYRDHRPDDLLHCLDDDWRPAPRVAAYAGYKAERPPDPADLPWQFELLDEVLDAFGAVRVLAEGWEADDVIGTLADQVGAGDRVDIVTGDRDLLQLVRDGGAGSGPADGAADPGPADGAADPGHDAVDASGHDAVDASGRGGQVRVLFTVKGVKELARFDEAGVQEKYGIPAAHYADFAILRGDPSDGLPGVPGVGEKTARQLVAAHGAIADVVAAADRQTPKLRERLLAAADYLAAMRDVVPVRRDLPLVHRRGVFDGGRLAELADRHALETPVARLREAIGA